MCELLGIGASQPIDIAFSFSGFVLRGGQTGPHADGWGVAMYEGTFARTFLEERPAFSSPLTRFLQTNPIATQLAIAHIRKKTRGEARLANTHPFVRVLHGRHLVFAHNGTLPTVRATPLASESPIGDTDSEHAFCVLVERLRRAFPTEWPDDPTVLGETVFALANDIGRDGIFNFLLSDGRHLFARCGDSLCHIVRRPPFGQATLVDGELSVDFAHLLRDGGAVAVVATAPLTRGEAWVTATPGTLWVFRDGDLHTAFDGLPEAAHVAATAWRPSDASDPSKVDPIVNSSGT